MACWRCSVALNWKWKWLIAYIHTLLEIRACRLSHQHYFKCKLGNWDTSYMFFPSTHYILCQPLTELHSMKEKAAILCYDSVNLQQVTHSFSFAGKPWWTEHPYTNIYEKMHFFAFLNLIAVMGSNILFSTKSFIWLLMTDHTFSYHSVPYLWFLHTPDDKITFVSCVLLILVNNWIVTSCKYISE